jgi:O-antigen ligase
MKISFLVPAAIALYLLFSMVSISASQIMLGIAFILWIIYLIRSKQKISFPGFFWPLLAYSLLSLVACIFSDNPKVSLIDSRELLLFLIVPLVYTGFQKTKDIKTANLALLASGLVSVLFSFFIFIFKYEPGERISGFMGHYMTQAGLLLLFATMALSMLIFSHNKIRYIWGGAFVVSSLALILTMTRNAWVGLVVSAFVLLLLYRPKLVVVIPVILALSFFISPKNIKQRALSVFSLKSYSNAIRIEYLKAGWEIIKDYPIFGTGPDTVDVIFNRPPYRDLLSRDALNNVHLHNNILQIAAERGVFTLLSWLVFIIWAVISLWKLTKNKHPLLFPFTAAALAGVLALFTAGLFEYNFGDSEVVTLFLYILTVPFTGERILKLKEIK